MFLGTYLLNFSGKGRVILPKRFRSELRDQIVVLMKGIDGGIWGFSLKGWEEFTGQQLEVPLTDRLGRDLRRAFFPNAEAVELDKQGRFVIPEFLLSSAKFFKRVSLIGAGDHFEIWSPVIWQRMVKKGEIE
jgi:MraZ protein